MPSIHSGWSSPCCHRRCSHPSTLQLESHCGELALFSLCLVPPSLCSITKERTEVIFQGTLSQDPKDPAAVWEEYQFLCKPGDVYRRPCLISPYHYRLDWLMWFAAFQVTYVENRSNRNLCLWDFSNFCCRNLRTNTQSFSAVQTSLLPHSWTVLKKTNKVKPFFHLLETWY